jgi:hypothetical protein
MKEKNVEEWKWVESEMIFWLFGRTESERKERGIYLVKDINTLIYNGIVYS